jgi:hypothetical protein
MTSAEWERLRPLLPPRRPGGRWRDLPDGSDRGGSYERSARWVTAGTLAKIDQALRREVDAARELD